MSTRKPVKGLKVKKGKGKKGTKKIIEEVGRDNESENMQDEDLLNVDQNNMNNIDQEQLTNEEKEEIITKALNTNNPLAPHNIT